MFVYENEDKHLIWKRKNRFGEMDSHSMEWNFFFFLFYFFPNHHQIFKKYTISKNEFFPLKSRI